MRSTQTKRLLQSAAMPPTMEIDAQYRALREEAGLLRGVERAWIRVSGAEGADFLQGQLTNDVEALEPGQGCYAALLDRKGHIQADMRVLRLAPDEILIDAEPEAGPGVLRHLSMYKIGRDAEVEAADDGVALLALLGPRSAEIVGAPLGPENSHGEVRIDGIECRAVATVHGADLLVDPARADELEAALLAAGAEPIGPEAAEIARVEAGRPRLGREMSSATMPQEAGINERAVSFTKGCYIGQETVARLHYKGKPNRHLRLLAADRPLGAGDVVRAGEREVGAVGTAVLSPSRGPIALAILRREAEPGGEVEVLTTDGPVTARVEEAPAPEDLEGG
jgi:folate-binding protein YgfZ